MFGPLRALTSGETYTRRLRTIREYVHTYTEHTFLPKKPTTLPSCVLSTLPRVEGAAPVAGFQLSSPSLSSRPESHAAESLLRRRRLRVLSLSTLGCAPPQPPSLRVTVAWSRHVHRCWLALPPPPLPLPPPSCPPPPTSIPRSPIRGSPPPNLIRPSSYQTCTCY